MKKQITNKTETPLSAFLSGYMEKHHLTAKDVVKKTGVKYATLYRILAGDVARPQYWHLYLLKEGLRLEEDLEAICAGKLLPSDPSADVAE